jgi:hypothetical protein
MASSVTFTAISDAKYLLCEPSAFLYPPFFASQDARQISKRAASICVIMLAGLNAMAWCMMIGLPNA